MGFVLFIDTKSILFAILGAPIQSPPLVGGLLTGGEFLVSDLPLEEGGVQFTKSTNSARMHQVLSKNGDGFFLNAFS